MHHITTPDNTRLYFKDWGAGRPAVNGPVRRRPSLP